MVYNSQFVAVVKCGGNILRDDNGVVTIPFGAEFSLFLKNENSRKARVDVQVDGKDVLSGSSLLIDPKYSHELIGYMDASGHCVTRRFKWIDKTQQIAEYRGDFISDGLITVDFAFEQPVERPVVHRHHYPIPRPSWRPRPELKYEGKDTTSGHPHLHDTIVESVFAGAVGEEKIGAFSAGFSGTTGRAIDASRPQPNADEGITVPGSEVEVHYTAGYIGRVGTKNSITLQLRGTSTVGAVVTQPVTVKQKLKCPSCGNANSSANHYCGGCGTNLR